MDSIPQRLTSLGQILPRGAGHTQKRRRERVSHHLDRNVDRREYARKGVGKEGFQHLKDEAEKVVVIQQGGRIEHATSDVGQVETSEGVYLASVAADARVTCSYQPQNLRE